MVVVAVLASGKKIGPKKFAGRCRVTVCGFTSPALHVSTNEGVSATGFG
jgi:hypothetical protein